MTATRRRRQPETRTVADIEVGQHDPMTSLARAAHIDLCGAWEPLSKAKGAGPTCTRAAGHSEGLGHGTGSTHPSIKHVSADRDCIAQKVWH